MIQLSLFKDIKKSLFPKTRATPPLRPDKKRSSKDTELLKGIWLDLRREWFSDRPELDDYALCWSARNRKRSLASCHIEKKRVTVAKELNSDTLLCWLDPLLYHEMCHAYFGQSVKKEQGRSAWHGPEFKALERRHPQTKELNRWLESGGWESAVRSHRAKEAWRRRRESDE